MAAAVRVAVSACARVATGSGLVPWLLRIGYAAGVGR